MKKRNNKKFESNTNSKNITNSGIISSSSNTVINKNINEMSLQFLNKSENEFLARTAVISFLSYLNPSLSWLNEIKTAVSEGVTNSIIHAYDDVGIVELKAQIDKEKLIIKIIDYGKGIKDINGIENHKSNILNPNSERAGIGFKIMESFVDKMTIASNINKGTIVTLEKMLQV